MAKQIFPIKENILPSSNKFPIGEGGDVLSPKPTSFENDLSGNKSYNDPLILKSTVGLNSSESDIAKTATVSELYGARRYPVYNPLKTENEFAYGQSSLDKATNGILKGSLLVGTTIAGGFGMLYGAAKSPFTGRLADIWDNEIMRGLDELNEKVDNEFLPNYYTDAEKEAAWYSPTNWWKTNFLFDKLIKNSGFAVGAMVSGNIANAAIGSIGKGAGALAAASATAAESSQAFKLFTPILRNTARAFSAGKNVEAAAILENRIKSIADITNKADDLSKIAKQTSTIAGINDLGRRSAIAIYSSAGEASFEALQTAKEYRNSLIEEYRSLNGVDPTGSELEKINEFSESVGKTAFFGNMALLSATEYVQLPYLMGSSYRASKQTANRLATKNVLSKEGKYVAEESGKLATAGRISKYAFDPKESFQEVGQYALQVGAQNYYNKAFKGQDADAWVDGFLYGFTDEQKGAFYAKEGGESFILGGLTGGLMQAKRNYQDNAQEERNTQSFLNQLNNAPDFKRAFQDRLNSVNRGVILQQEQEEAIERGDKLEALDLKADMMHNYLSTRIKYGRFDMVMADLAEVKQQAMTEQGLAELKAQGFANVNDTPKSFSERISEIQKSAISLNTLYDALNLRYSGIINEQGERVFSPEVIDKMTYAASKIEDYDNRINELSSSLGSKGVFPATIIGESLEGKDIEYKEAVKKLDETSPVNKEDILAEIDDLIKLSKRRKFFIEEYNTIKSNPNNFKDQPSVPKKTDEEGKPVETVTIKTKDGEEQVAVGEEYFLGKVVEYDKAGKEIYRFPKLTIIGENEDGTIKIKSSDGTIKDVSKSVLEDYKLGKVSDTLSNKKAKYFMDNVNTIFEFNFGKGKKVKGRLEYSPKDGALTFVYKGKDGKIKRIEVTGDQFVPKEGYSSPMISAVGELTPLQKQSLDEFTAEKDARTDEKKAARLKILSELFDELSSKQESTKELIAQKQKQVKDIQDELTGIEESIKTAKFDARSKKALRFKSQGKKALEAAMTLSRMKDQLEKEIESLQSEEDELNFNIAYVADLSQNIEELPTDSKEFLAELKDQRDILENLLLETGSQINSISSLIDKVQSALDSAISYLRDLIEVFQKAYPKTPLALGQEWIDFLKENPNFLKKNPLYKEHLKQAEELIGQVEDLDIIPNERTIKELKSELETLQKALKQTEKEIIAKDAILSKFEEVAEKYKKQREEEAKIINNQALKDKFLGTLTKDIQPNFDNKTFEPEKKKDDNAVINGTVAVDDGKPHQKRANDFGINLPKLKNRNKLRAIEITAKTEAKAGIPGLIEHLLTGTTIDKNTVVAVVFVEDRGNGKFDYIDENGEPIQTQNFIESGIYQVRPTEKLALNYGNGIETMFRETTSEDTEAELRERYAASRTAVLASEELQPMKEFTSSFGILKFEQKSDDKGNLVPDYGAKNTVESTELISEDDLTEKNLLEIATTNDPTPENGVSFKNAIGRVFLRIPGTGLLKLNSEKLGRKRAEAIFSVVRQLAQNAQDDPINGVKNSENLLTWLRSVVYWGIPKNLQTDERKQPSYNSIWFEQIGLENKLFISGKEANYSFVPSALDNNREEILTLLESMYHNISNGELNKGLTKKYYEITGIDSEGKPIIGKTWDNYQTYLLSKGERGIEEVPLTTPVLAIKGTDKQNREGIYFVLQDNIEAEVAQKKAPAPQKEEGIKQWVSPEGNIINYTGSTQEDFKLAPGGDLTEVAKKLKAAIAKVEPDLEENELRAKTMEAIASRIKATLPIEETSEPETIELSLNFIPNEELLKNKSPLKNKKRQEDIKKQLEQLNSLLKCLSIK